MDLQENIEKLIREEKLHDALSLCESVIKGGTSSQTIKLQYVRILHELYRYKEAFELIGTLEKSEESLITEAAIIVDWVSDYQYGNYEAPPFNIDDSIKKAIHLCDNLMESDYKLDAMYFKANALSAISQRTAARLLFHEVIDHSPISGHLLARTIINLGNGYLEEGRFVEAIEIYEKAIRLKPDFSMGWSGLGSGLNHAFHQTARIETCLLYMALFCFQRADDLVDPMKIRYAAAVKKGLSYVMGGFSEIPSKEVVSKWNPIKMKLTSSDNRVAFEKFFYEFAAENSLFLNLCLGCTKDDSYLHDKFLVGGITSEIKDCRTPYNLFSYLSEIRRDYFVARYLLVKAQYEGDVEICFLNSIYNEIDLLDYSSVRLNNELLKICLQKTVGIFDKIAFFLNEYEGLNLPHHTVWFSIKRGRDDIFKHIGKKYSVLTKPELKNLCALKSISDDLKHPYFETCKILRDAITHKYLKVHMDILSTIEQLVYPSNCQRIIKSVREPHHDLINPKNYHITEADLIDICLRTLKMCRAAILYLSGHVKFTELNKKTKNPDKIIPSLYLNNIHKPKY